MDDSPAIPPCPGLSKYGMIIAICRERSAILWVKSMPFNLSERLALHGGPKAKRTPFGLRKRHGEPEKRYLSEVIDADVLFYFSGTKVFEFQKRFAKMYGRR